MSYGITPYALDVEQLGGYWACTEDSKLVGLRNVFRTALQDHDRDFASEIRTGAPPLSGALRGLLWGEVDATYGYAYCYALKLLCEQIGEELTSDRFADIDDDFLTAIDHAADALELTVGATALVYTGAPPPYEIEISDYPYIGWLSAAATAEAAEGYRSADLSAIENTDLVPAMEQLRSWLEHAAGRGVGLVSFYL